MAKSIEREQRTTASMCRSETGGAKTVDVARLEQLVGEYVNASVAPSTAKVYDVGQKRYLSFCNLLSNYLPTISRKEYVCVSHI